MAVLSSLETGDLFLKCSCSLDTTRQPLFYGDQLHVILYTRLSEESVNYSSLKLLVHGFAPSTSSVVVAFLSAFLLRGFSGCFPSCGRPSLSCLYSHLHCTCNNSKLCVDYRGSKYFLLTKMEPLGDAFYTLFCYFEGSFYFVMHVHSLGTLLILNFAGKFLPVLW